MDPSTMKFKRMELRMKEKVARIKTIIKKKNQEKLSRYKKIKEEQEKKRTISNLPEDVQLYTNLRIFQNIKITPETPRPPVVMSDSIEITEGESKLLSKCPKFTLRNVLNKEMFLVEYEKSLIKEKYGRIGLEEVDGKVIRDDDDEDQEINNYSEWLEIKSRLPYDFEDKSLDFGRCKATDWKLNKRITLPKSGSPKFEAYLEVRRAEASKIFDECMRLLGHEEKDGDMIENLSESERSDLKSLKKKVNNGNLLVCQTDKSGRFAILTRQQYLDAGYEHTKKDVEIEVAENEDVERTLNGHLKWFSKIVNMGEYWDQMDRNRRNLLNQGLAVCKMTLLIKDHKSWTLNATPPSRSLMAGNKGGNTNMSEFLSIILEPVANESKNCMEVNSTDGLLAEIVKMNDENSEQPSSPVVADPLVPNSSDACKTGPHPWAEDGVGYTSPSSPLECTNEPPNTEILTTNQDNDFTFHITEDQNTKEKTLHLNEEHQTNTKEDLSELKKESRTKMIRRKMMEARKRRSQQKMKDALLCRKTARSSAKRYWNNQELISSRDVENSSVQEELEMVIIGSDVKALYPSLSDIEVSLIVHDAVMKSNVKFDNINHRIATQYIAMHINNDELKHSDLRRVLPIRTAKAGAKPGVNADPEKEVNWSFPKVEYTKLEKRKIVATLVQIGILVMMNTHVYGFDGKIFLQKAGGPIGLRSTCSLARIVMNEWDAKWMEKMVDNNITIRKGTRYMDDLRVFLKALKAGWRWFQGGLWFCEEWKKQDLEAGKSSTRSTGDALLTSMNEIMDFLVFTLEIHEDFDDLMLPTLDTKLYMEDGKIIQFEFYQKPMASNLVLQSDTALSENVKVSSLKEEVIRRLKHTSTRLDHSKRLETLEDLSQRMTNSGHSPKFIKRILINGITSFESKLMNCKLSKTDPKFRPLYQHSDRNKKRLKKKAMSKANWFKDQEKTMDDESACKDEQVSRKRAKSKKSYQEDGRRIPTTTVMFVPNTKNGLLLAKLMEREEILSQLTGFRIKFAEAGGTQLGNMFSLDMGKGQHCRREVCIPCDLTEERRRQDCKTRNLLYETFCLLCNPSVKRQISQPPGMRASKEGWYIGETSRSFHERMGEHMADARGFKPGSHILKHWIESHPELKIIPPFQFRILKTFKECLTRQVTEAVAIMLAGTPLLNGKCEYLSNCIARVTIEEDTIKRKKREMEEDIAEKERIKKIEEFKTEKERYILGTKRKNRNTPTDRNIKPRLRVGEPDYEADTTSAAIVGDRLTPHFDNHARRNATLAIEYHQHLALEDFSENDISLKSNLVATTKKTPPVMNQKENPKRKKQPTFGNNYILNLYGWGVWWENQEKQLTYQTWKKFKPEPRNLSYKNNNLYQNSSNSTTKAR